MLGGNQLVDAQVPISFRVPTPRAPLCAGAPLTPADAAALTRAVRRHYHWEWFVDDLPVTGFVGPPPDDDDDGAAADPAADVAVYTHRAFHFAVNGDRIIHVNVTPGAPVRVGEGARVELSYSVDWEETDVPFGRRFETYLDASFFEHQIHW